MMERHDVGAHMKENECNKEGRRALLTDSVVVFHCYVYTLNIACCGWHTSSPSHICTQDSQ